MSKRISRAQRARNLINKGYSNKYIFEHFPSLPKQTVYYARYMLNKKKGLASLPKPAPVASGTGITSSAIPLEFEIIDRPKRKYTKRKPETPAVVAYTPPKLTMWQKIKLFFGA